MAPSYANIFMGKLKSTLLSNVSGRPEIWWSGGTLMMFLPFGHTMKRIYFYPSFLMKLIPFIRPSISLPCGLERLYHFSTLMCMSIKKECFVTDLHTKLTDTHQYLHRDSCHPTHCKRKYSVQSGAQAATNLLQWWRLPSPYEETQKISSPQGIMQVRFSFKSTKLQYAEMNLAN